MRGETVVGRRGNSAGRPTPPRTAQAVIFVPVALEQTMSSYLIERSVAAKGRVWSEGGQRVVGERDRYRR